MAPCADATRRFIESLTIRQELGDRAGIAASLEGLAAVAAQLGRPQRALLLAAAAESLREAVHAPIPPVGERMRDRWLVPLRRALGPDAAALAWAQCRALSVEHALALTVVDVSLPDPSDAYKASGSLTNLLTRREREVAVLLTRGLSNRQIAEQLVITERTVAAHVEHILGKLGFASRHLFRRRAAQPVHTTYLRLDEIDESAESRNSRRTYDETRLAELAASIHEHGVLQPILVTPAAERFRVICGNRRLKAARQAGLTEIPAIVCDHVDDHTVFLWNLVENIQRVDLSTKERVAAICELAQFGLGIREISRGTGLAPSTISKWIRLADKPTVMRALEDGHLDIFRAMHLAPITLTLSNWSGSWQSHHR